MAVDVDEAFFMGGVAKTEILKSFNPHIFFDDQHTHCESASDVVSTGHVPYGVANEPTKGDGKAEKKAPKKKKKPKAKSKGKKKPKKT